MILCSSSLGGSSPGHSGVQVLLALHVASASSLRDGIEL